MRAVGKAANKMVEEVRRQFREIPGLLEGRPSPMPRAAWRSRPQGSLKQMILPGVMAVAAPIASACWSVTRSAGCWPARWSPA
jgi:K(+)-stimulated pyrophosphate-energized sodium pump